MDMDGMGGGFQNNNMQQYGAYKAVQAIREQNGADGALHDGHNLRDDEPRYRHGRNGGGGGFWKYLGLALLVGLIILGVAFAVSASEENAARMEATASPAPSASPGATAKPEATAGVFGIFLPETPAAPNYTLIAGKLGAAGDNGVLLTETGTDNPEVFLVTSSDTVVIDSRTGAEAGSDALKQAEGQSAYAYGAPVLLESAPPQLPAYVVLLNVEDGDILPALVTVQSVQPQADGRLLVTTDQALNLWLGEDTELTGVRTEEVPGLSDIQPGTRLLSWHTVTARSYPAQASPAKVTVLPEFVGQ